MRWIMGPFALAMLAVPVSAQQDYRAADADRRIMLDRLGIADTRPGADGSNRTAPNAANYDETKAGQPKLPELLRFADGTPVTTARGWERRRHEIVALFDREVYGRVPTNAPTIRWRVDRQEHAIEGDIPVIRRWLTGMAGNLAASGEYHWFAGNFLKICRSANRASFARRRAHADRPRRTSTDLYRCGHGRDRRRLGRSQGKFSRRGCRLASLVASRAAWTDRN